MTDTPDQIELPPPDALPAGPGNGIGPQPDDGPQPQQDPDFEESEPLETDFSTVDARVGQALLTRLDGRVGAAVATWTATKALNEARAHLGFREGRNNDNPFWRWPPNYTWLRWASYCASAQSYVAWNGGGQTGLNAVGGGHYNCAEWTGYARRHGMYHSSGEQRGDLVMFDWTGRKSGPEHVGILESSTASTVTCIEFNTSSGNSGSQSNGGGCYRRTRSKRFVVGYVRPRYGGEVSVKPIKYPVAGKVVLSIDGAWGAGTTKRLQQYLGLKVDGDIGPNTRKALQKLVGVKQDGDWGPATRKALQRLVHVTQDGSWGPTTVKAFQRWLNAQPLHRSVTLTGDDESAGAAQPGKGLLGRLLAFLLRLVGLNGTRSS